MHELALAQNVVKVLCEEAERHRLRRVEAIRLRIGVFRAVVPELLQTCLAFATRGTVAEGSSVELEVVPGRARCPSCGTEYDVDELLFLCPSCERVGGEILAGEELELVEIEGE